MKKNLVELYDDVDLCYKVMGLTFSDPPEKVDRVCQGLLAEYNKALRSSDPAARREAKSNLEQVRDLYERITGSLIYKDYAREYEKYRQLKADQAQPRKQKQQIEKTVLVGCPHCGRKIYSKMKVCIYCDGKISTPLEQLMARVFSARNLVVVAAIAVLLVIAGVVLMSYPQH